MESTPAHPNGETGDGEHDAAAAAEQEEWPDDMEDADPWEEAANRRQAAAAMRSRGVPPHPAGGTGPRNGGVYVEGQLGRTGFEGPPARIVHDSPPVWNGSKPETQTEPYLKLLGGWLTTTRTQKSQQGMTILQYTDGDLKVLINELDIGTLTSEDSGQRVFDHIKENYQEFIDKPMPQAIENAIFGSDVKRRRGEGMVMYCSRKNTLFKELERAKVVLPDEMKGYLTIRDAQIGPRAWDTINGWTQQSYGYKTIVSSLKKVRKASARRGKTPRRSNRIRRLWRNTLRSWEGTVKA